MLSLRNYGVSAAAVVGLFLLSACAGSVSTPVPVAALAPDQQSNLKLTDITDEAAPGVVMASYDLERLLQLVKAEIAKARPDLWHPASAPADPPTATVKVVITKYDPGNAVARFLLAGLGQIRIEGDVVFSDAATGQQLAKYQVSKDFSFGGIYGGSTTIEDVEKGFAASVADILAKKQ